MLASGFEPLENLTGVFWVVSVWPDAHKRSVAETRAGWMGEQPEGRLWFVRSPWTELTTPEALALVWANLPSHDEAEWPAVATAVLAWPVERAVRSLRFADGEET